MVIFIFIIFFLSFFFCCGGCGLGAKFTEAIMLSNYNVNTDILKRECKANLHVFFIIKKSKN